MDTSTTPSTEYRYFLYDPLGDGMVFFRCKTERDLYAQTSIQAYLDDTWAEEVEQVVAGEITHAAQCLDRKNRPDKVDDDGVDEEGESWDAEWEWKGNFTLEPLPSE